ncbi:MAG: hypothetical protein MI757_06560, partial [Pirellulales bacterium]|nr:hypothetical protein [Pirellulales bacterium]
VRDLPPELPSQAPISVRFQYLDNGRLTVTVNVDGKKDELKHEITRENSLSQEQLDGWKQYIQATMTGGASSGGDAGGSKAGQRWA